MVETMLQLARRLKMFASDLPEGLAMTFINNRYRQLIDSASDGWSFQYGSGNFVVKPSIVGTASVIQGSNLITVTAGPALPGDRTQIVGRQAMFASETPFYDVVDNQNATTFVTAQPYGGVTGSIAFEITNVFFTPDIAHADFERLIVFLDPPFSLQYPFSFTFEEVNNIDAQRSASGDPFLLADAAWNTAYLAALPAGVTDSFGYTNQSTPVPRKELYPRQTSAYLYPYYYKKRIPDMQPQQSPQGFIRGDVLIEGGLADLALWEGPAVLGRRANPVVHNIHNARFNQLVQEMQIIDQSVMQRSFQSILSYTRLPFPTAFYNSRFAQLHPLLAGTGYGDEIGGSGDFGGF